MEPDKPANVKEIDVKKVVKFVKKKNLIPIILIIIAIAFSTNLRMYPSDLPITDGWAESSVYSYYRNEIERDFLKKYPNHPSPETQVQQQLNLFMEQNRGMIDSQIEQLSNQYKDNMRDEDGNTYLLAIDPYYWYSRGKDILGTSTYTTSELRGGRTDFIISFNLHPHLGVGLYKFLHIFNKDITLSRAFFLMPPILIALALIPAFYLTRKIAGNFGGFFAAMLIALNSALLARTPAGFADTDAYHILFPLYIIWFLMLAWNSKDLVKTMGFTALVGLLLGLYATVWPSGWSHLMLLIPVVLGAYGVLRLFTKKSIKQTIYTFSGVMLFSFIFVSILRSAESFFYAFIGPFEFIFLKAVAVKTIWPNVLTTVAEFNEVAFNKVFSQMGADILYLIIAVGLILLMWKKKDFKYPILLSLWFLGTIYSFSQGVRFAILAVPAFAILVGIGVGLIYKYASDYFSEGFKIKKYIAKPIIILIFCLLLISPLNSAQRTAMGEMPSYNDQWHAVLMNIKYDSNDSIITSWWDFGHWFYAMSERRATFDGAYQGKNIHWVGRSFLLDNEKESANILKMLNCDQNNFYERLVEAGDTQQEAVKKIYEKIENNYNWCNDTLPHYIIVSEDMIGKAGVWGHFGSWDFDKAEIYQNVVKMEKQESEEYLTEKGYSLSEADVLYYDIQSTEADKWISGWPGYSNIRGCNENNETFDCDGFIINKSTMDAEFADGSRPKSFAYLDNETFIKKDYKENTQYVGAVLLPSNEILFMDPVFTGSMFTRLFFLGGKGLKYFEPFDYVKQFNNQKIYVYKMNYEGLK